VGADAGNLVWIDLEMTGLDADRCTILEIATLVTDSELNVLAEGPELVIHNDEVQLESLSDWSRDTFTRSGLLDRVRASTVDVAEAERRTLAFVRAYSPERASPLCGNSVHTDRQFLYRHMRALHDHLHYRNVDVSTVKELLRRWYPDRYAPPPKAGLHEALADIRESIRELRYYRDAFIAPRQA
jgi:oligoribonuclease